MREWLGLGAAIAAAAAPMTVLAATAPDDPDSTVVQGLVIQGRISHEVRGLVVTPKSGCIKARNPPDPDVPEPKLVSSFPADGASVKPGIIVFRLTFDLPMACPGLLDQVPKYANPCPAPLVDPVISKDRRTFLTVCVLRPGVLYGVWLNNGGPPRWKSLAGHAVGPHMISFRTTSGDKVENVHDAIEQDAFLRAMVGPSLEAIAKPAATATATATPAPPAAPAQPSEAAPPAAPPANAEPANVAPVIVTAPLKPSDLARSRSFIEAYAAPTAKLDRYARWQAPPCITVVGVAPAQAASVKARVEQAARAAGLKVGGAGCKANVEIEFTDQPQDLVDRIVEKTPQVMGFQPGVDPKALKTVTRPIQAWYMTATRGGADTLAMGNAMAGPPRPSLVAPDPGTTTSARRLPANAAAWAGAGRAPDLATPESLDGPGRSAGAGCSPRAPSCQSVFWNVLVVVDANRVQDRSVESLSDYVAMLALSQPRSLDGCLSMPSIIDLLAPAPCTERAPPDALTPADTAFLTALYASDPLADRTRQQAAMSERMAGDLVKAETRR